MVGCSFFLPQRACVHARQRATQRQYFQRPQLGHAAEGELVRIKKQKRVLSAREGKNVVIAVGWESMWSFQMPSPPGLVGKC